MNPSPACSACLGASSECPSCHSGDETFVGDASEKTPDVRDSSFSSPENHLQDQHQNALPSPSDTVVMSPRDLGPALNDVVLGYYFTTFVHPFPVRPRQRSYFMIMPRVYLDWTKDSPLEAAMLSMAYSRFRIAPGVDYLQCISEGRRYYQIALNRLNQAMVYNEEAKSNETLLTVIIMQILEAELSTISVPSGHLMHAAAVVTLIKMRGREGFQDEKSKKVLLSARGITVMNDHRRMMVDRLPFSRYPIRQNFGIPFLEDAVGTELRIGETSEEIVCPITHVSPLWQDAERLLHQKPNESSVIEVNNLVTRCVNMDEELVKWMQGSLAEPRVFQANLPLQSTKSEDDLYWRHADVYEDIIHARSWNEARMARLFVHDIKLRCHQWLVGTKSEADTLENYQNATILAKQTSQSLIDDICATIPFFTGQCTENGGDAHPLGYYFCFPVLALCQINDHITLNQRRWILNKLVQLQRRIGLHETLAGVSVRNLLKKLNSEPPESSSDN